MMNINLLNELLEQDKITQAQYTVLKNSLKFSKRNNSNTISRLDIANTTHNGKKETFSKILNLNGKRYVGFGNQKRIYAEHNGVVVLLSDDMYTKICTAIEEVVSVELNNHKVTTKQPIKKQVNKVIGSAKKPVANKVKAAKKVVTKVNKSKTANK